MSQFEKKMRAYLTKNYKGWNQSETQGETLMTQAEVTSQAKTDTPTTITTTTQSYKRNT